MSAGFDHLTEEQRAKVDDIYQRACTIFTNLGSDSTESERKEAKQMEWRILEELRVVDPEGYKFHLQTRDE
jgi:hypothetical protein